MLSIIELTKRINVRGKQIRRLLRDGELVPDLSIPIGDKRSFDYFRPERVSEICKKYGWIEITNANRKDIFIGNIKRMQMDHSYKPVFLMSFFDHMDEEGTARLEDVVSNFKEFYDDRIERGLVAEKQSSIFNSNDYTDKDVERLILSMPFKVYEEMGVMSHSKYIGVIQLDKQIAKRLNQQDIEEIMISCKNGLAKYFGEE